MKTEKPPGYGGNIFVLNRIKFYLLGQLDL